MFKKTKQMIKDKWAWMERGVGEGQGGTSQQQKEQEKHLTATEKILKATGTGAQETEPSGLESELLRFVALPWEKGDPDRLQWWKFQEENLPMLASIVKEIFAIPAASSKSKMICSIGTQVNSRKYKGDHKGQHFVD